MTKPVRSAHHALSVPPTSRYFPDDGHLVVVSDRKVRVWSHETSSEVFRSREGKIVAAQAANNGSLLVATTGGWFVNLCEQGKHEKRRWRLKTTEDRATCLKISTDSSELFYSTSLQHSVIRYSMPDYRILDHTSEHSSPITAFAVSLSSKYVITTSSKPPTIYLQQLPPSMPPVLVQPYSTCAPVTEVQFHPKREDIFLLGYDDGTISLHTVTRILLMQGSVMGSDGNLGHLKGIRKRTNRTMYVGTCPDRSYVAAHERYDNLSPEDKQLGRIAAAAFMGGFDSRVVSVTEGGKCRIVDFERGATILRTWHLRTICTCLAVYSPFVDRDEGFQGKCSTGDLSAHIIAVGRGDGAVQLFNAVGLLLGEKLLETSGKPIVSVHWTVDSNKRQGRGILPAEVLINMAMEERIHAADGASSPGPGYERANILAQALTGNPRKPPTVEDAHDAQLQARNRHTIKSPARARVNSLQLHVPGSWISESKQNSPVVHPQAIEAPPREVPVASQSICQSQDLISGHEEAKRITTSHQGAELHAQPVRRQLFSNGSPQSRVKNSSGTASTHSPEVEPTPDIKINKARRDPLPPLILPRLCPVNSVPIKSPAILSMRRGSPRVEPTTPTSSVKCAILSNRIALEKEKNSPVTSSDWATTVENTPSGNSNESSARSIAWQRSPFGARRRSSLGWKISPQDRKRPSSSLKTELQSPSLIEMRSALAPSPSPTESPKPATSEPTLLQSKVLPILPMSSRPRFVPNAKTRAMTTANPAIQLLPRVPTTSPLSCGAFRRRNFAPEKQPVEIPSCGCDCAAIISAETSLLRSEVAALRKTLLVVGIGVGRDASVLSCDAGTSMKGKEKI